MIIIPSEPVSQFPSGLRPPMLGFCWQKLVSDRHKVQTNLNWKNQNTNIVTPSVISLYLTRQTL